MEDSALVLLLRVQDLVEANVSGEEVGAIVEVFGIQPRDLLRDRWSSRERGDHSEHKIKISAQPPALERSVTAAEEMARCLNF
jgi:hypothetical protein